MFAFVQKKYTPTDLSTSLSEKQLSRFLPSYKLSNDPSIPAFTTKKQAEMAIDEFRQCFFASGDIKHGAYEDSSALLSCWCDMGPQAYWVDEKTCFKAVYQPNLAKHLKLTADQKTSVARLPFDMIQNADSVNPTFEDLLETREAHGRRLQTLRKEIADFQAFIIKKYRDFGENVVILYECRLAPNKDKNKARLLVRYVVGTDRGQELFGWMGRV